MLIRCGYVATCRLIETSKTCRKLFTRNVQTSGTLQRAQLLDGKNIAGEIYKELCAEIQGVVASGKRAPHLVLVRVGSDPASGSYVKNKMKAAESIGE
ncbi:hypothetical protein SK128_015867 [Halocaridina rubra]|uniref:Tetrahydrofolate dehydrogenase/cyclohydrolase catalytic domain-containing protein n=1 Tax=Halocaridina rubra TaxID=373956 RepID=A0AAN8WJT0_HALRR